MPVQRQPQPHHAQATEQDCQRLTEYLTDISKTHFTEHLSNLIPSTFKVAMGRINAKIVTIDSNGSSSVWGFVELASGAIMKAASFKAPEPKKHERGNVHLPDNWKKEGISHYGPAYR